MTDISLFSGDSLLRFNYRCSCCTKYRKCDLRIQLHLKRLFGGSVITDSLRIDSSSFRVSCREFRQSCRKTSEELRSVRYLKRKKVSEQKGQLTLF